MTSETQEPAARFEHYVFDENTLDELATLICGDDGPYYRRGYQLSKLLERAGWDEVEEYADGPRRVWLADQLHAHNRRPGAIAALVRRLADSREYLDNPAAHEQSIRELDTLLTHEGFRIKAVRGRAVVYDTSNTDGPERQAPAQLTTTIAALVNDPDAAHALQRRLDEALACQDGSAHLSAVIMMGSLLEGVLVEVLTQRGAIGANGAKMPLQQLISRAHERGYIQADVHEFSQVLKEFRNLVHVHKQITTGNAPDRDTARVCWWVVVAALNDLADTAP